MIHSIPALLCSILLFSIAYRIIYSRLERQYQDITNKPTYTGRRPYAPPVEKNQNN